MVEMRLPDAAALQRTAPLMKKYVDELKQMEGVENVVSVAGFSVINMASIPNSGMLIIKLDNWSKRKDPELHQRALMNKVNQMLNSTPDAASFVFATPAIKGMGAVDGFNLVLQDNLGRSPQELAKQPLILLPKSINCLKWRVRSRFSVRTFRNVTSILTAIKRFRWAYR